MGCARLDLFHFKHIFKNETRYIERGARFNVEDRRDNSILLEIKEGVAVLNERVENYHSELKETKVDVKELQEGQRTSEKFQWKIAGGLIVVTTILIPFLKSMWEVLSRRIVPEDTFGDTEKAPGFLAPGLFL